jgi:hypothetical protein
MLLTAILALNPLGLDGIYAAFFANETLTRNIWGSIALTGMAVMALIVLLDWRIRVVILNRRARSKTTT